MLLSSSFAFVLTKAELKKGAAAVLPKAGQPATNKSYYMGYVFNWAEQINKHT